MSLNLLCNTVWARYLLLIIFILMWILAYKFGRYIENILKK